MDSRTKSIVLIVLGAVLLGCAKQDSVSVAHNELARFYNYSTVDWCYIAELYHPSSSYPWPEGIEISLNYSLEEADFYLDRTQNAKIYLHQHTLPLRIGASDEFIDQLNHTEAALDSVFINFITQEYYLRCFEDCYQEIMPQEVTKCFEAYKCKK